MNLYGNKVLMNLTFTKKLLKEKYFYFILWLFKSNTIRLIFNKSKFIILFLYLIDY